MFKHKSEGGSPGQKEARIGEVRLERGGVESLLPRTAYFHFSKIRGERKTETGSVPERSASWLMGTVYLVHVPRQRPLQIYPYQLEVEKPKSFLPYSAQTKESFTCFYFQVFILFPFNLELTTENIRHKGT